MSMTRDPNRPHRFLVDRMRSIEARVTEWVNDQVEASGATSIRVAHARLLAVLGDGARPTDLAHRLGVTKGAVGQLVRRLETAGYVRVEPDPDDRRSQFVRPTARTLEAFRVSRQALFAVEDEWHRVLGPRGMADLEHAMDLLDTWRPGTPGAGSSTE
jgi:DNA-binding MarR family transcriptional regulator